MNCDCSVLACLLSELKLCLCCSESIEWDQVFTWLESCLLMGWGWPLWAWWPPPMVRCDVFSARGLQSGDWTVRNMLSFLEFILPFCFTFVYIRFVRIIYDVLACTCKRIPSRHWMISLQSSFAERKSMHACSQSMLLAIRGILCQSYKRVIPSGTSFVEIFNAISTWRTAVYHSFLYMTIIHHDQD
jgi:hypothetical protein